MADVTISALTQAFPAGSGIIPFSSGTSTFGSAISALYLDSNPYKTNATLPWTKLVVAHDTTNNTVGAGPSGSLALASFYANTIVDNNAVPRGLEIGAPAGNVASPVYLKVSSTSNRFAIFDQFNNENFTIHNRNVGIGTAAPARQLTVDNATNPEIGMYTSGTERVKLSTGGSALSQLVIDTAGQPRVIINSTGMGIGIGTAAPTEKLTVMGNISASGNVKVDGGYIDTGAVVTLANNAYVDFPNASGMVIINVVDMNGAVSAYLCGGTGVAHLGTSNGPQPGTLTFVNSTPPLYRFTNKLGYTAAYAFCFIKTRSYALTI